MTKEELKVGMIAETAHRGQYVYVGNGLFITVNNPYCTSYQVGYLSLEHYDDNFKDIIMPENNNFDIVKIYTYARPHINLLSQEKEE